MVFDSGFERLGVVEVIGFCLIGCVGREDLVNSHLLLTGAVEAREFVNDSYTSD